MKDTLLRLGPSNYLTQVTVRVAFRKKGFRIDFGPRSISLTKNRRTIILRAEDLFLLPVMTDMHPHYFDTLLAENLGNDAIIDFTKSRTHTYLRTGITLNTATIAEDDSMAEYTRNFTPRPGTIVFDLGAHAGLTTIELSRMVTAAGHVYAFEPDDEARSFLLGNLARHGIGNVTVIDCAVGERSGRAAFSMDGTQAAGLVECLVYVRANKEKSVRLMTLEEACNHVGVIPNFIKSDIEGAELGMVRGSLTFIANNSMHMAFETHRLRDGSYTHDHLGPLLTSAGYTVEYARLGIGGQNFLFATPRASA